MYRLRDGRTRPLPAFVVRHEVLQVPGSHYCCIRPDQTRATSPPKPGSAHPNGFLQHSKSGCRTRRLVLYKTCSRCCLQAEYRVQSTEYSRKRQTWAYAVRILGQERWTWALSHHYHHRCDIQCSIPSTCQTDLIVQVQAWLTYLVLHSLPDPYQLASWHVVAASLPPLLTPPLSTATTSKLNPVPRIRPSLLCSASLTTIPVVNAGSPYPIMPAAISLASMDQN